MAPVFSLGYWTGHDVQTPFYGHVHRLNVAFKTLGVPARAKTCGRARIIEEGKDHLQEDANDSVMDAILVGAAQKAEHYEIAAYGTVCAHARTIGRDEIASMLEKTLEEKKEADKELSDIAESFINTQAAESDETG